MLEAEKAESLLLMVERMRRGWGIDWGLGCFYRGWLSRQIESLCYLGALYSFRDIVGGDVERKRF